MGGCNSSESTNIDGSNIKQEVRDMIKNNKVMVFSKAYCPFCSQLKQLFNQNGLKDYKIIEMDRIENGDSYHSAVKSISG